MIARTLGLLGLLAAPACTSRGAVTLHLAPPRLICYDGIPARLFVDPRCPNGVCGYTCQPDRWLGLVTQKEGTE